jgi:hypothetical protein
VVLVFTDINIYVPPQPPPQKAGVLATVSILIDVASAAMDVITYATAI